MNYTKEQTEAINALDTNLQIIACAGSGKTQVISERIVNLLTQKKDVSPGNIIAFTYTEKAATELKSRVLQIAKEKLGSIHGMADMYIGTIHAWCLKALQENQFGYQRFSVLDEIRLKIFVDRYYKKIGMKDIYRLGAPQQEMNVFTDTSKFIQLMNIIRESELAEGAVLPNNIINAREKYEQVLSEHNYFDFTMIMSKTLEHLNDRGDFFNKIKDKTKYLIVDEYQDVNPIQEKIIRSIYEMGANICVVGDDDQNIYQWRGSDISNILTFSTRYKDVKSIKLVKNFRSSVGIIDLAGSIIVNNSERLDKKMEPPQTPEQTYERDNILYNEYKDVSEENEAIARMIESLKGVSFIDKTGKAPRGLDYSDFCILLRKWNKTDALIEVLKKHNIPFVTAGVNKLFERDEVQAAIGIFQYLNEKIDSDELISLWTNIKGNILSIDKLLLAIDYLDTKKPQNVKYYWDFSLQDIFWEFIERAEIREEKFSEKLDTSINNTFAEIIFYNLGKFSQVINDYEAINFKNGNARFYLFNFLNFLRYAAIDYYPEGWISSTYKTPNAVQVMTIHQAKGLEFPVVFIPGLNKNYLPSKKAGGVSEWHFLDSNLVKGANRYKGDDDNHSDERRLFYVALTRSQKFLIISRAPDSNNRLYQKESLFVGELTSSDYIISSPKEQFTNHSRIESLAKEQTNNITLNFSILKDFFECSYRFKLVSLYGFCNPLNIRMGFGQSIHNALTEIHKEAYAGKDITTDEVDSILDRHINLPYASPQVKKDERQKIIELVSKYVSKNSKDFASIVFVEQDIQLDLGNGIIVTGRIDLVKKKNFQDVFETTILEFKSDKEAQNKELTIEQLSLYALGHQELTGQKADYLQIYNLDENTPSISQKLEDHHLTEISSKVQEVVQNIRQQNFKRISEWKKCQHCMQKELCSGFYESKKTRKK